MKITINIEAEKGNPLFYALLVNAGSSIPTKNPSQWFYEAGKALYYLPEEELRTILEQLQTETGMEITLPKKEQF